jgi:predicted nucleic acid-binding protein
VAFIVIYDACVLYPESMRDLLVRLGQTDLVQAKWTDDILDEFVGRLVEKRPDLKARLERTRELMNGAVRDSRVTGYRRLIDGLTLPDPKDRHVLAAAIRAGAQVIVTYNLKDFPEAALAEYGIEAEHPDTFVYHLITLAPPRVGQVVREMAEQFSDAHVEVDVGEQDPTGQVGKQYMPLLKEAEKALNALEDAMRNELTPGGT